MSRAEVKESEQNNRSLGIPDVPDALAANEQILRMATARPVGSGHPPTWQVESPEVPQITRRGLMERKEPSWGTLPSREGEGGPHGGGEERKTVAWGERR